MELKFYEHQYKKNKINNNNMKRIYRIIEKKVSETACGGHEYGTINTTTYVGQCSYSNDCWNDLISGTDIETIKKFIDAYEERLSYIKIIENEYIPTTVNNGA